MWWYICLCLTACYHVVDYSLLFMTKPIAMNFPVIDLGVKNMVELKVQSIPGCRMGVLEAIMYSHVEDWRFFNSAILEYKSRYCRASYRTSSTWHCAAFPNRLVIRSHLLCTDNFCFEIKEVPGDISDSINSCRNLPIASKQWTQHLEYGFKLTTWRYMPVWILESAFQWTFLTEWSVRCCVCTHSSSTWVANTAISNKIANASLLIESTCWNLDIGCSCFETSSNNHWSVLSWQVYISDPFHEPRTMISEIHASAHYSHY